MIETIGICSIAGLLIATISYEIGYRRGCRDERAYILRTRVWDKEPVKKPFYTKDADYWKDEDNN